MDSGNRELVEPYLRCYNEKDVEAMLELFAEGASFFTIRESRITRLVDYMWPGPCYNERVGKPCDCL